MRLAIISLLTWFAHSSTSGHLQHRVRRSKRVVPYQHVRESRTRDLHLPKFKIPDFVSRSTASHAQRSLRTESSLVQLDVMSTRDDVVWLLHVQYDDGSIQWDEQKDDKNAAGWSMLSGARRLYEQFVLDMPPNHNSDVVAVNGTSPEMYDFAVMHNETDASNVTTVEFEGNITNTGNESINGVYTTAEEQASQFQPLRIAAVLADSAGFGELLSEEKRSTLFHDLLSPALVTWSSALRVDPVVGNLTVDAGQLVDGKTCGPGVASGLPSVVVPVDHFTVGIPDADMIVYLSLGFVKRQAQQDQQTSAPIIPDQTGVAGASNQSEVVKNTDAIMSDGSTFNSTGYPKTREDQSADAQTKFSDRTGTNSSNPNATTLNSTMPYTCSGEYLAAASYCSTDQYDRPTAALLHICINEGFFEEENRNRNIITIMHELGHALGFNSQSMAYFRRPDGTPITPRIDGDIPDSNVECTGPQLDRPRAMVPLPSEEILKFRTVRGGVRAAEVVTPSVVQVVRNQFDCQQLTGAELESGETLPLAGTEEGMSCIGNHWERRVFSTDLMNPVIDVDAQTRRISTLTLAYFADSGWYQVDLSKADVAAGWGRGAGCNFVNDTCIGENGEVPPKNRPFFCNDIPSEQTQSVAKEIHGCTPDLSRKALCSMGQYDLDLPSEYQYFNKTYGSDVGGADPLMDYCPVYSGFENGLCSNSANEAILKAVSIERFGERNSRCLMGETESKRTALCLPIACVVEDRSLRVKVDGKWHLCEESDQEIIAGDVYLSKVICPDPRRICPTFYCPFDCLGTGGTCDYLTGNCICESNTVDNTTQFVVCGGQYTEKPNEESRGPFLRPLEPSNDAHSEMPHPESPLSDYYVPTERSLHNERSKLIERWMIAVVCLGIVSTATVLIFAVRLLVLRSSANHDDGQIHRGRRLPSNWWPPRDWFRPGQQPPDNGMTSNRNKDKMIASVLVDMRMHNQDTNASHMASRTSIAETDFHMTESEASGVASESLSEMSCVCSSERSSEADLSQDEIFEEDLLATTDQEPVCQHHIRRRAVVDRLGKDI